MVLTRSRIKKIDISLDTANNSKDLTNIKIGPKKRENKKEKMAADPIMSDVDSFWNEINDIEKLNTLVQNLGTIESSKFEFNGFNPDRLLAGLLKSAKDNKRSRQDFFTDVVDMILIGLCRGNIREDQIEKTIEGGGAGRIKDLIKIYNIRKRTKASDRSAVNVTDLTFTRMISLLPHIASLLLKASNNLARTMLTSSFGTENLPKCMMHSGFAGLIPGGIKYLTDVFSLAHVAYMIDFSKQINPAANSKALPELYNIQMNFCKISINNSKYTADMRIKYLISLGLNDSDSFEAILNVANVLHNKIKGKPMDLNKMRSRCLKNNVIAYRDDNVLKTLTVEAGKMKAITMQQASTSHSNQEKEDDDDDVPLI